MYKEGKQNQIILSIRANYILSDTVYKLSKILILYIFLVHLVKLSWILKALISLSSIAFLNSSCYATSIRIHIYKPIKFSRMLK